MFINVYTIYKNILVNAIVVLSSFVVLVSNADLKYKATATVWCTKSAKTLSVI